MSLWMLQTETSHLWKVRYTIILLGWRYLIWNSHPYKGWFPLDTHTKPRLWCCPGSDSVWALGWCRRWIRGVVVLGIRVVEHYNLHCSKTSVWILNYRPIPIFLASSFESKQDKVDSAGLQVSIKIYEVLYCQ